MLVAGAFLFTSSFWTASTEDLGFDRTSTLLVVGVDLQGMGYAEDEGRALVRDALARIEALPSVRSASTTNRIPFRGDWSTDLPAPEGAIANAPDDMITVGLNTVGPDDFDVMGVEIVAQAYLSVQQAYQPWVSFIVRTDDDASALADPVLVSLFGLIALVLASAGLYGVVAFAVSRRTRELGVRMALGASRSRVARGVVSSGLRLAGLGMGVGLVGAFALRRFTRGLLYGVEPTDPIPLLAACLALLVVTAVASLLPARRATRIDPMEAIRTE